MSAIRKSVAPLSRADFHSGLEAWVEMVMALDKRRLALLSFAIDSISSSKGHRAGVD